VKKPLGSALPALLVTVMVAGTVSAGAPPPPPSGVVVETVQAGGAAEKAGLQPGDLLSGWERSVPPPASAPPAQGSFRTCFDWYDLRREQSPRGAVALRGSRAGVPLRVLLPPEGAFSLAVLPVLDAVSSQRVREAGALEAGGDLPGAAKAWQALGAALSASGNGAATCWAANRAGRLLDAAQKKGEAREAWNAAVDAARREGLPSAIFEALAGLGEACATDGDSRAAEQAFLDQREVAQRGWGDSLHLVSALMNLNGVYWVRGDYDRAEPCVDRAVAIAAAVAPGSLDLSRTLNNQGNLRWVRGDLAGAEAAYGRSLALKEALAPDSLTVASACNNLGVLSDERGDFEQAESYFHRALALRERLDPGGLVGAKTLNNLGYLASKRGLLDEAEVYYRRALAIREKVAPESPDTAASYGNLASLAEMRGDLEAAEAGWRRALELYRRKGSEGSDIPQCLSNLGRIAAERGDGDAALDLFRQAETLQERQLPGTLNLAETHHSMGLVLLEQGDLGGAEAALSRALAVRSTLAPGTLLEAETLAALAALQLRRGDGVAARQDLERAVGALEQQRGRLGGGNQATESFSARGADIFRNLVALQARTGEGAAAFATLERFRARSLLEMLAARDLDFAADAPPELLRERKLLDHRYDALQADLASASASAAPTEVEALQAKLKEAALTRRELGERIRKASPRLAGLQEPAPLDLEGVQGVLPGGTLFLSYVSAADSTWLFALLDGRLEVFPIPVTRPALAREVRRLRHLIADPTSPPRALDGASRRLYGLLLAPARRPLSRAARVILCPDGPLHALPFAALRGPRGRYLVEEKPLSTVVSATVLADLLERPRRGSARLRLVAFGDPARGTDPGAGPPLPAAREEVRVLGVLLSGRSAIFVGAEATEEEVRRTGPSARYLHFACHGLLDGRFPLDSGLLLAEPPAGEAGRENGRLQAWEILQSLRLDADLVTLSACETGLGREMGGEGLVGLTRAFLYAGARSVVSSLWSVGDASTARLMESFYAHLEQGLPRDEALRAAQREILRGRGRGVSRPEESHPFHWAAFVLSGDGR